MTEKRPDELSHVAADGTARMVDVSAKPATARSDMAAYMRKRRAALKALRGK